MLINGLLAIVIMAQVVMPNPSVTPGVTNPNVTQSNIQSTICVSGFTATIRPPSSYTTSLKVRQLASGYAVNGDYETSHYEEDHLISLELGGHPTDPRNLWPEPYADKYGARIKDRLENKLHDLVCSMAISLRTAQKAIAGNWEAAYVKYVGPLPTEDVSSSGTGSAGAVSPNIVSSKGKKLDPRFSTCKAANGSGYGPYYKGINPEYLWYRDANSDGKVC
jgi:hypothetical protein